MPCAHHGRGVILLSAGQAAHPVLWSSSSLQLFLEASEGDFLLEVARGTHEAGGGAKKKLASTLQLFRDLGQSTANLVASGRHQDEEEDPDYLKVGCCKPHVTCWGSCLSEGRLAGPQPHCRLGCRVLQGRWMQQRRSSSLLHTHG